MKYSYSGLSDEEVNKSRELFGDNELPFPKGEKFIQKLLLNFNNPIIIILCVALLLVLFLSFFELTKWYEALAIAIAVILAVFVSTISEYKNENSFQRLQEESSKIKVNIFRNGILTSLYINEVVKGDLVLLQTGDKVPADGIIIFGELKLNQASLTGESEEVHKTEAPESYVSKEDDFFDPHTVFRGSVIEDGEAVVLVNKVGFQTYYGKVTKDLSISDERLSPLQLKLKNLAALISKFGYIAAVFIFVANIFENVFILNDFNGTQILNYLSDWPLFLKDLLDAIVLAIIIVVAAVPEGLPMMIAIVLSLNMRKMLNEKVLVRKLLGIETTGSLNILFSDKTGTLTKGNLEASYFFSGDNITFRKYEDIPDPFRHILKISIKENNFSVLSPDGECVGGNITERAILNFVEKKERIQSLPQKTEHINTVRFDSNKKFSATEVDGGEYFKYLFNSEKVQFVKGAIELILQKAVRYYDQNGQVCEMTKMPDLIKTADDFAEKGIRLIAIAISEQKIDEKQQIPDNLTLIGVIGLRDEIRNESESALELASKAGIQVVMITGDRKGTAKAIASEIGLLRDEKDIVFTSDDLKGYSDSELKKILPELRIVARALPTDKSRLVRIAKSTGLVVGMTGDGVNDSGALKQADVGFAMGSGSEVAKEAGDIVILDDNFSSITNAVRYGRAIFQSIRKFIVFQLTVNISAVLITFLGPFFGIHFPLTIIQLLWINIIMDTLAALAFGSEPALNRFMFEKPVRRAENILTTYMISSILTNGLFITAISLIFLTWEPVKDLFIRNNLPDNTVFLSAFFNLFIFLIVLNGFNVRTEKVNLFESIKLNPGFIRVFAIIMIIQISFSYIGGTVLRATGLLFQEWIIIFLIALLIIPIDLFRKMIFNFFKSKSFSQ